MPSPSGGGISSCFDCAETAPRLLDAVLCLMQAAWASRQPDHGLPANVDPLEGWIVSAEEGQGI